MFVLTSDDVGIRRFEKILGIKDIKNQELEARRLYVKAKLNNKKMSLSDIVDLISDNENKAEIVPDINTGDLTTVINATTKSKLETINKTIDEILPMNIFYKISANEKVQGNIYRSIYFRISPTIVIRDTGGNNV